ncbi:MAG: hypothetical protein P8P55_08645 [Flavobacteriaceae bacterium]|jgi:tetratricopeptide (TPR) repeat protein|nr:hypothetical protein [Flavobacteriaceae bacterium]
MKRFLLILLSPFLLIGQNYTQEFEPLFESKNYDQAVQKLEAYLVESPQNLELLERIGDAYGFQSDWNKAASKYKQLIDLEATNADYHFKYGGVLGKLAKDGPKLNAIGLISNVKVSFLNAAQLNPKHINVRWALVELYTQLPGFLGGSYKKAISYADELEQLSKVNGYFAKAYVYEDSDQGTQAKIYYKLGLENVIELNCFQSNPSNSSHFRSHNNLVHFLIAKASAIHNTQYTIGQRYIQTFIDFKSSKDSKPLESAYVLQAQLFRLQGEIPQALSSIESALQEMPGFKPALKEKQLILLRKP